MLRKIVICALLVMTLLTEGEGRNNYNYEKDHLISEIADILEVGNEDDIGNGKRHEDGSAGRISTGAGAALTTAVNCILKETVWKNVPENVVDNEWNELYKDDDWFKNNTFCFIAIYNAMNYIKKPEMRKELDAIMTTIRDALDCKFMGVSTSMRELFIETFAVNKTNGTEGDYVFPPEYAYVGIALDIMLKRCAKQESDYNQYKSSLWQADDASSAGRRELQITKTSTRSRFGRRHLEESFQVTSSAFQRDKSTFKTSYWNKKPLLLIHYSIQLKVIVYGGLALHFKTAFNMINSVWEKRINTMRLYVEAIARGDESQVKSYERDFENDSQTKTCTLFQEQMTQIDQTLTQSDSLVQRFLLANGNFVSGLKQLFVPHCARYPATSKRSTEHFGEWLSNIYGYSYHKWA